MSTVGDIALLIWFVYNINRSPTNVVASDVSGAAAYKLYLFGPKLKLTSIMKKIIYFFLLSFTLILLRTFHTGTINIG